MSVPVLLLCKVLIDLARLLHFDTLPFKTFKSDFTQSSIKSDTLLKVVLV